MYYEEIILRQKRADIERFAERRRLLKEAGWLNLRGCVIISLSCYSG